MGSGITALGSGSQPRDRDHSLGIGITASGSRVTSHGIRISQSDGIRIGISDQMLPHFGDQESKFVAKIWDQL